MTDTKRLKIVQASLEVFDSDTQAAHDVRKLITLDAHIYMGTESGSHKRKVMFRTLFEAAGYLIYVPEGTDAWIAVRKKLAGHGHRQSYKQLWGTGKAMHDPHPYDAKGITLFEFDHRALGHVGIVECHYMTKGRYEGQAQKDKPGDPVDHRAVNKKLAHGLSDALLKATRGDQGIGFFGADTNMLDQHSDVFFGMPLTTCWDELKKHPNTGHGNIDVVGSCDEDRRVKCHSATVLDDKKFFLHSDHFVVVTEYDVRKLNREA